MKRLLFLSALCFSLIIASCGDDDGPVIEEVTGTVFEGTAANGFEQCGWLIDINGTTYLPNVLNSQFQQEGLSVFLHVEFLGETATCGTATVAPERLRIEQIRVN